MSDLETLEQRFWERVWRCRHKIPCKKCCWPWARFDTALNWKFIWHEHAACVLRSGAKTLQGPVHRVAYELYYGPIPFRGHRFHFCHQCHFGPCCNPAHILPGSISDNARDRRELQGNRQPIRLPDGRIWSYEDACNNESYFREARNYRRIWAGPVPSYETFAEQGLSDSPSHWNWPGVWSKQNPTVFIAATALCNKKKSLYRRDLEVIQKEVNEVARRHNITLEQLQRLSMLDLDQLYTPVKISYSRGDL